jgi:hypothetical protein
MVDMAKLAGYRSPEIVNIGDVSAVTQGDKKNYADYLGNPASEFTGPVDDDGKPRRRHAERVVEPESTPPKPEPDEGEDISRKS